MKKPLCINCKTKEVCHEVNLRNPSVHVHLFCADCNREYNEPTHCLDCGIKLITFDEMVKTKQDMNGSAGLCYNCKDKKVEECRKKGLCVLCYVNPQANIINKGGKKTEFCKQCLMGWSQMCATDDVNRAINSNISEQVKKRLK